MTFDEHIEQQGVTLPINSWLDIFWDYLNDLEKEGYDIPIDDIIEAAVTAQTLAKVINIESPKEGEYVH